ncbi:hypothetical protein B0H13DRAFT_1893142 [Mycena leptocephala]|nr:hypothetical protein B0H13DRAFT_1893142 [Mycena leptocephala]
MVAVAVAAAFLSRGLATIFRRTSMQKVDLESRIQFTTLLKVILKNGTKLSIIPAGDLVEDHPAPHAGKATRWLPVATANSLLQEEVSKEEYEERLKKMEAVATAIMELFACMSEGAKEVN